MTEITLQPASTHTPCSGTDEKIRYHYLDNLRALAMMLGIFFHVALAYDPLMHSLWLTADAEQSSVLGAITWFLHSFRMPLFFLIAGFFACYLSQKRGGGGLIKNRSLRVMLPFVVFLPLILIAYIHAITLAMETVVNQSPMLALSVYFAEHPEQAPEQALTTSHLWFLYYLIMFYPIAVIFRKIKLFRLPAFSSPKVFLAVFPLLLMPALLTQLTPVPAAQTMMPEFWMFGYYGLFFWFGWYFFGNRGLIDQLKPYGTLIFAVAILAYAIYYFLLPQTLTVEDAFKSAELTPKHALTTFLWAIVTVYSVITCLLVGKRYLDKQNKALRLISDSSYWIYLIHLPLLFYIQFALLDRDWSLWIKFAISFGGVVAMGFISYLLLVRWTPIGWMLNGRR